MDEMSDAERIFAIFERVFKEQGIPWCPIIPGITDKPKRKRARKAAAKRARATRRPARKVATKRRRGKRS